jgi:hypothetical protein
MKNLIAISAAALTAASASAGYVNTVDLASWTSQGANTGTQFPAGPGYSVQSIYTDTLHNATYSAGTVSGGHGLGVYSLTGNANTNVFASGSLDNTNIGGSNTTGTPFGMTFTFSASGGPSPANFMGGVGFAFTVTPGQTITVTANYTGGSATTGTYTAASAPTALFVGFWSNGGVGINSVSFTAGNANSTFTISDIYYGLVPAPGAVALVGVAGLVGSRRRRA